MNQFISKKISSLVLIILLFVLFFYLMVFYPENWIAWFLLIISYLIPITSNQIRKDGILIIIIYLSITLRHIFALYNSFVKQTSLAPDAIGFYEEASYLSFSNSMQIDFSAASIMYKNFLAYILTYFGDSLFLVSEVSIFVFTLSIVVVVKISNILNIQKEIRVIILFFCMLPTTLFFTSLPMREAFQIFFLLTSCYYGLLFWKTKRVSSYAKFFISILILSVWHNGLMIISPVILTIFTLYSLDSKVYKISHGIKSILAITIFGLVIFLFILVGNSGLSSNAASSLANGNALAYTDEYRLNSNDAGSMYSVVLDSSSIFGFIKTIPFVFLNYLFAPFPWEIRNLVDVYAFLEGVLRFFLIVSSIKLINRSLGTEKQMYLSLFWIYIILELVWSLGTLNWGTAMRHHTVGYSLLLILGFKKKKKTSELPN